LRNVPRPQSDIDYQEILAWLSGFHKPPRTIFITHGEVDASQMLRTKIEKQFGWHSIVPNHLQTETLS
jgi:metallo-beta-lactamase family protein